MYNENTSGCKEQAIIPDEIKKWNWGAFWFSCIWGLFNRTYISLLALIPILNIIVAFYLGAKGNELAWRNRNWSSIEEFKNEQKTWSIGGWVVASLLILYVGYNFVEVNNANRVTSNITNQVLNIISKNESAKNIIGDDYIILFEPAIQKVETTIEVIPVAHTMFISGADGTVFVHTSLNKDYKIKQISIQPPNACDGVLIQVTE